MDQTSGISEEKRQWMEEVGIYKFHKPMCYYHLHCGVYSQEYMEKTPLEELKERHQKLLKAMMKDN